MRTLAIAIMILCSTLICAVVGATLGMAAGVSVACALFTLFCAAMHILPKHPILHETKEQDTLGIAATTVEQNDIPRDKPTDNLKQTTKGGPSPYGSTETSQVGNLEPEGDTPLLAVSEQRVEEPTPPQNDEREQTDDSNTARNNKEDVVPQEESEQAHDVTPKTVHESSHIPTFDYDAFSRSLLSSGNPLTYLRSFTRKVKDLQNKGKGVPSAKVFLARLLDEAGINDEEDLDDSVRFDIVMPHRTGMFYLRANTPRMAYGSLLRIVRTEAALNALYFAHEYYDDLNNVTVQDLYHVWQRTCTSICAQAPDVDTADWSYLAMPWQVPFGPSDQGEWAVRRAIAEAIESVQVPYRLEARFRCNVEAGDVAIEFKATPARAFAHSASVDGLGIVPTTAHMREREASHYAARMGILLANYAFRSSAKIRRVWIAAIEETPSTHACLYSMCTGRRAFSRLRMSSISSPLDALRSLGASMQEQDGILIPTSSCFYLEDERFCPPFRHDLWNLSERVLPATASQALGTKRVSGLLIHEELPRTIAADKALSRIAPSSANPSTQQSVQAIMDVAHDTSDLGVWCAAERVSSKLVDGQLEPGETESIRQEIIAGDSITKGLDKAQALLARQEPHEALRVINHIIGPLERQGTYIDTNAVAYRSFDSFTERVVYNRLNAHDHRSVVLVPDAYLMAHLVASAILISLPTEDGGDPQLALAHARRALDIAPLNGTVHLGIAACLEATGAAREAIDQLKEYLEVAYHPHGIALAYFRLASLEWELNNQKACMACYQQAVRLFPPLLPFAIDEFQALQDGQGSQTVELMDAKQIEQALGEEDIPIAPTSRIAFILYDGATASVDAEVFPVAREIMHVLEALSGDDVLRGIRASLEKEPDK